MLMLCILLSFSPVCLPKKKKKIKWNLSLPWKSGFPAVKQLWEHLLGLAGNSQQGAWFSVLTLVTPSLEEVKQLLYSLGCGSSYPTYSLLDGVQV